MFQRYTVNAFSIGMCAHKNTSETFHICASHSRVFFQLAYTPLVRQKLCTFLGDKIYGTAIGANSVNPMQAGINLKSFDQII